MLTEPLNAGQEPLTLKLFELSKVLSSKRAATLSLAKTELFPFGIFPLLVRTRVVPYSSASME